MTKEEAEKQAEIYKQGLMDVPLPLGCDWWIEPVMATWGTEICWWIRVGVTMSFAGPEYAVSYCAPFQCPPEDAISAFKKLVPNLAVRLKAKIPEISGWVLR